MATDIGPRIGIDGEAEYRKQIQNIIQQAKTLDSEMRLVAASFTEATSAQEKNKATASVLTKQVETQKKRVEELSEMWGRAAKELGENDTKTLKWKAAVNDATAELKKMEGQLQDTQSYTAKTGESMEKAGKQTSGFADMLKANLLSDAIMSGMRFLADAAMDAARAFVDFAKDGLETASNLQEVQNVVDVTFGDSADAVDKFAKSAAGAFGMSELSAKQYTGTMGAMLKSMGLADEEVLNMSTDIAGLAGDMASFYNLDTDEAFAKLRAGISGETEPLKQLGINMSVANLEAYALSQGIDTAYKSMSQAEQATLRYQYLMSTTADAQGDFARTSDSFANQSRILSLNMENLGSAIGQKILPMVNDFATSLNNLLSGQSNMGEFVASITGIVSETAANIKANLPQMLETGGEMLRALMQGMQDILPEITGIIIPLVSALAEGFLEGLPMILELGGALILELIQGMADATPDLVQAATDAVITIVEMLSDPSSIGQLIEAGIEILMAVITGLIDASPDLIDQVDELINAIVQAIVDNLGLLVGAGIEVLLALVAGMVETIPQLLLSIGDIIDKLIKAFGETDWGAIGEDIINGLIRGIERMISAVKDTVKKVTNKILGWFKDDLDINSPSGVFADEVGKMIPPGITLGIDKAMPAALRDMRAQFSALPGLSAPQPATAATHYGGVVMNIQAAPGQDVNALADAIMVRLDNAVKRKEAVYA